MIVLYGTKYQFEPIGKVPFTCPECSKAECTLKRYRKKNHVYWILLNTIAEGYAVGCERCKKDWTIDHYEGERLHAVLTGGGNRVSNSAAAADSETGIMVNAQMKYNTFEQTTLVIEINGREHRRDWGRQFFPLPPGNYHVKLYGKAPLMRCGIAEVDVKVVKGEQTVVTYVSPFLAWSKGDIATDRAA